MASSSRSKAHHTRGRITALSQVKGGKEDLAAAAHKNFELLGVYEREDPSFIQGLYFDTARQQLLESTGLEGQSVTQWLDIDDTNG